MPPKPRLGTALPDEAFRGLFPGEFNLMFSLSHTCGSNLTCHLFCGAELVRRIAKPRLMEMPTAAGGMWLCEEAAAIGIITGGGCGGAGAEHPPLRGAAFGRGTLFAPEPTSNLGPSGNSCGGNSSIDGGETCGAGGITCRGVCKTSLSIECCESSATAVSEASVAGITNARRILDKDSPPTTIAPTALAAPWRTAARFGDIVLDSSSSSSPSTA
mmetsp:Transcript_94983/g.272387  ORF Transcript_94983/g.272387 Transcript_94983/m.272387 type:complete len:215 (+) Transcript_94983:864-1508(+)